MKPRFTYINVTPFAKIKNAILREIYPGYGCCSNCGSPWNTCKPKDVVTGVDRAMFAVCEDCWDKMTLDQRVYAYYKLWKKWGMEDEDFEKIEAEICKMTHSPHYNSDLQDLLKLATKKDI
jgi:hypothetical protein